jgi:hypothetical protein
MKSARTALGAQSRAKRALLIATAAAAGLAFLLPCAAHGAVDPTAQVPEFNKICSDLAHAREELRAGVLDEPDFGDRILALFVQADSMRTALLAGAPGIRRPGTPGFAMAQGLRYLIESLRQNYVGMVGQSGLDFMDADRAFEAAVAWRSGAMGGGADAERP